MKRLPLALLLASVALPLTATAAHAQTAAAAPTLAARGDGVDVTAPPAPMRMRRCAVVKPSGVAVTFARLLRCAGKTAQLASSG